MTKTTQGPAGDDRPAANVTGDAVQSRGGRAAADGNADVTRLRGEGDTAPAGTPNTSVPPGTNREDEPSGSRAARELREAADRQPMSEGVRQDILQGGTGTDPLTGKVYTVDDLSDDDREAYRRSHADRTGQ